MNIDDAHKTLTLLGHFLKSTVKSRVCESTFIEWEQRNLLPIIKSIQQHWKPVTIFLLLVIAFLSLYPLPKLPEFQGTDKTYHLVAYFLLALPSGLKKPNKWVLFIFLFIIFGGVIEMIQPYVNRYSEWLDFFANTIGVISGFFIGVILNNQFLTSY